MFKQPAEDRMKAAQSGNRDIVDSRSPKIGDRLFGRAQRALDDQVETDQLGRMSLRDRLHASLTLMKKYATRRYGAVMNGLVRGLASPAYITINLPKTYPFSAPGDRAQDRGYAVLDVESLRGAKARPTIKLSRGLQANLKSDWQRIGDDFRAVLREANSGRISKR